MDSSLNQYKPGIKLLLSMKIDEMDLDDREIENNNEDYVEEVTDEEYNKNVNEMDSLIFDMIRTKHKLKLNKLQTKIKTKQDLLDYLNCRDINDNKFAPEPYSNESEEYLNKLKINNNNRKNNDYDKIKEKLFQQELNMKNLNGNYSDTNLFITENKVNKYNFNNNTTDDMSAIYDEIKKAELRCDDLLDDIDECIKLGEDLENIIETKYTDN